ncbi:hypothetical protein CK203_015263 [Vitis vinifera]|uniref:DUF4283 domain-containing protein n=1 Tax=Vitis vinifera TaxID=29760 RepID=A0A438JKK6_VITVI|nr:hypothetical protein CK203_015263 [Vitis vinifera]
MRGKTRTHLMEICFNSRGRFMKITEIVTKRKPLVLVVPEGVKGNGWETLRKTISSVQDLSDQAVRASKEMFKESQVSKGMYREGRSYANVVAEEGPRNGTLMPVGKWARAVICETEIHFAEMKEGNESGKGISEACRLVKVSVTGEAEGDDLLRPESTRNKDELMSAGSSVFQRLKNAEGLRATAKDNECHNWRPRHRSRARSSDSNSVFQSRERKGRSPVHETEAGSSNGGPAVPLSSKLQRLGSFAKEANRAILRGRSVSNKGVLSLISKTSQDFTGETEGERISRCNLVNKVCSSFLSFLRAAFSEQGLPLVGAFHPNFLPDSSVSFVLPSDVSFFFIPLESSFTSQCGPFSNSPVIELSRCVGMSCSEDVAFPLETSNRNFKDCHFLRESLSNPKELCVSDKASSPKPEPPTLPLEGFQVKGLTPRKLVKIRYISEGRGKMTLEPKRGLGWLLVVLGCFCLHEDLKLEYKRIRRFVSNVWKGISMGWAALPACGASGGL